MIKTEFYFDEKSIIFIQLIMVNQRLKIYLKLLNFEIKFIINY